MELRLGLRDRRQIRQFLGLGAIHSVFDEELPWSESEVQAWLSLVVEERTRPWHQKKHWESVSSSLLTGEALEYQPDDPLDGLPIE